MADWSAESMLELGVRHAKLEAELELEGTLATLIEDPVYEFFPLGLGFRGAGPVRRYYENLFEKFMPLRESVRLVAQWASESSVAQEYEIQLRVAGNLESHRVIGILVADGQLLGGERVYAGERLIRARRRRASRGTGSFRRNLGRAEPALESGAAGGDSVRGGPLHHAVHGREGHGSRARAGTSRAAGTPLKPGFSRIPASPCRPDCAGAHRGRNGPGCR
jgi:hypothetical protein